MDKANIDVGTELKQGNVASLVKRISSELKSKCPTTVDPSSRRSFVDFRNRRLKVVAAHAPASDEELRLELNDTVDFISEEEDGHIRGRLNGKVGTFPSSCVKFIEPPMASRLAGDLIADSSVPSTVAAEARGNGVEKAANSHLSPAASSVIQPKKVMGIGFGNIFAGGDGKIGLKSARVVPSPSESKKSTDDLLKSSVASKKSESASSVPKERKELVRADYAYNADNDDELSLKVGDVITVLSKECEDPGWWYGELNGHRGVFPDNFVSAYAGFENQPPSVPVKPAKSACPPTIPNETSSSDRKSDHAVDEVDATAAATSFNASVTSEKLDRLGAFRLPIFAKTKSSSKPVEDTDSGHLKGAQEKNDEVPTNDGREKLSHLTASRPKMKKRPPSQSFLKAMAGGGGSQNGYAKIPSAVSAEVTGDSTPTVGSLSSEQCVSGKPVLEDLESLRRAFNEFRSNILVELGEMEKRIAGLEVSISGKGSQEPARD